MMGIEVFVAERGRDDTNRRGEVTLINERTGENFLSTWRWH